MGKNEILEKERTIFDSQLSYLKARLDEIVFLSSGKRSALSVKQSNNLLDHLFMASQCRGPYLSGATALIKKAGSLLKKKYPTFACLFTYFGILISREEMTSAVEKVALERDIRIHYQPENLTIYRLFETGEIDSEKAVNWLLDVPVDKMLL